MFSLFCNGSFWQLFPPILQLQLSQTKLNLDNDKDKIIDNTTFLKIASNTCQDWGLDRYQSKFLLDVITSFNDNNNNNNNLNKNILNNRDIIEVCKDIISRLQNPALILALFSTNSMKNLYVEKQLQEFLEKYNGKISSTIHHHHNYHGRIDRISARNSFFLFYTSEYFFSSIINFIFRINRRR